MSPDALTLSLLTALVSFTVASSITPGPNNIMLTTSGVNFGMARTVPHMAGIFTGLIIIMLATGFGLGFVFQTYPIVRRAVQAAGIAYTLYLAWKIATAGSLGGGDAHHPHPMRFGAAVAFQWVNPKLWVMTITATALYVHPGHVLRDVALVTLVFSIINIPCMLIWAGFGVAFRDFLKIPARIRAFNLAMGLLLAASVVMLLNM